MEVRVFGRLPLAVGMVLGLAGPVLAQASRPPVEVPARAYVVLMLARDPAVHTELQLSADQIRRVQTAVAEVDEPFWQLRDVPVETAADKLDPLLTQLQQGLDSALEPRQRKRLDEIVMQARGLKALVSHDVVERLKLSSDQVEKIAVILRKHAEDQKAGQGSGATGDAAASKAALELLAPEQQQRLAAIWQNRFDLSRLSRIGGMAPELRGVEAWTNSQPLTLAELRGKVVVVHFWTFACSNCINNLPHYAAWFEKFPASQFAIVGIHTPELSHERDVAKVRTSVRERKIAWPVATDPNRENWAAWANHMWPSVYLIDKRGQVRSWWYGELNWQGATGEEQMRRKIQQLIDEAP